MTNKIPVIKHTHIVKKKLKTSSAETLNLAWLFGVFVGDKVEENNPRWKIYLTFRKILDFVTSPRFIKGHLVQLEYLIEDFLSQYSKAYGDLQFKFHDLLHIVRIMRDKGPIIYFSSSRYESKHTEIKPYATLSKNTMNTPYSLCIRSLLKLAYLKFTGKFEIFDKDVKKTLIDSHTRSVYFPTSNENDVIYSSENILVNGYDYEVDVVFVMEMGENDLLSFGRISQILLKDNDIFFVMEKLAMIMPFDDHCFTYRIKETKKFVLKNIKDIPDVNSCYFLKSSDHTNEAFVVPPYKL